VFRKKNRKSKKVRPLKLTNQRKEKYITQNSIKTVKRETLSAKVPKKAE